MKVITNKKILTFVLYEMGFAEAKEFYAPALFDDPVDPQMAIQKARVYDVDAAEGRRRGGIGMRKFAVL